MVILCWRRHGAAATPQTTSHLEGTARGGALARIDGSELARGKTLPTSVRNAAGFSPARQDRAPRLHHHRALAESCLSALGSSYFGRPWAVRCRQRNSRQPNEGFYLIAL